MGLPKINSGIGLICTNYVLGDDINTLNTTSISAIYAYEFKLNTFSHLRLGLSCTFTTGSAGLVGFAGPPPLPPWDVEPIAQSPNLGTGALFYTNGFYAGAAVYNIFQPIGDFSANSGYSSTDKRIDIQTGGFINLNKLRINPNLMCWRQGSYTQILPGLNLSYGMFTIGSSYRYAFPNVSSVNYIFGISKGIFKLCYSYDQTMSGAIFPGYPNPYFKAIAGSHELSLVLQLNKSHDTSNKPMIEHLRQAF
jgi:type IX secretion system PorP/SprF family membrane protein